MTTMNSVERFTTGSSEMISGSFFAYRKEGAGFIGLDGTRFAQTAYYEDFLDPRVTTFTSPQAVRNYISMLGEEYDPNGLYYAVQSTIVGPIREEDCDV